MSKVDIRKVDEKVVTGKRMLPRFQVVGGQIVVSQQVRQVEINIPIHQVMVDGKVFKTSEDVDE